MAPMNHVEYGKGWVNPSGYPIHIEHFTEGGDRMRKQPSVIRCGRLLASLLALGVAFWAGVAMAGVPVPVVTGPIPANAAPGDPSHDYPQLATSLDLARPLDLVSLGYVEEEYFFSGTANVYTTPTLATGTIALSGH